MGSDITPPPPPPPQMPYGYAPPDSMGTAGAPGRKRRTAVIVVSVVGGVVLLAALFVAGLLTIIFGALRSSEPYKHASSVALHDARVATALGAPVRTKWWFSGNINVSGPSGHADLAIPVAGSRREGTVYVVAKKSAGRWTYQTLELEVEGQPERINLLSQSDSETVEK